MILESTVKTNKRWFCWKIKSLILIFVILIFVDTSFHKFWISDIFWIQIFAKIDSYKVEYHIFCYWAFPKNKRTWGVEDLFFHYQLFYPCDMFSLTLVTQNSPTLVTSLYAYPYHWGVEDLLFLATPCDTIFSYPCDTIINALTLVTHFSFTLVTHE